MADLTIGVRSHIDWRITKKKTTHTCAAELCCCVAPLSQLSLNSRYLNLPLEVGVLSLFSENLSNSDFSKIVVRYFYLQDCEKIFIANSYDVN